MKQELIELYKKNGWTFGVEEWVNGHNGNDEKSYYFSSPRMRDGSAGIWKPIEEISEKQLLDREAAVIANNIWDEKGDEIKEKILKKWAKEKRLKPLSKKK